MSRPLYLGLDLGTSGVRSSVVDNSGDEISSAQIRYSTPTGPVSNAEEWWRAAEACLAAQCAALEAQRCSPQEIRAIAVDGTSGSMVLINAQLQPVTPALMYHSSGFDAESQVIERYADPGSITRGSNSALARLMRLQSLDPAGNARFLCHQADFIAARLCGRGGFSDDNNALKTGFDPGSGDWPEWLAKAGVRTELLPEIHRVGASVDTVCPEIRAQFGFSADLVIRAGTTDSIAAFLASGAHEVGDAVTSLGTTLAIKLLSLQRIDDQSRGLYSHRLGDRWLVGGASNSGGGVLLDHFQPAQLEALSRRIDAETDTGLDYYPLSRAGERFPINDPAFQPRMTPRPADDALFLHGLLEGIARIEAQAYRALVSLGAPEPQRIFTAGGGAQNPAWTAIRRRMIGPQITESRSSEAATGMARLCWMQDQRLDNNQPS